MNASERPSISTLGSAVRRVAVALLCLLAGAAAAFAQVNAYVASTGNTSVLVLNTATNTQTATVPGTGARTVTISPDGKSIYSTNFNGYSVIDAATNTVTSSVVTGELVIGVVITLDGSTAYVANNGTGTVSVVDTATNTVTATLPIENEAIAITPDGSAVWVDEPSISGATIQVINTATQTITSFPIGHGGNGAFSIAFTPDGAFAYLANLDNTVSVIDTSTDTEVAAIPVGAFPLYVAVSPNGAFAYAANLLGNSVSVIDTATNTVVATVPVGSRPRGVAFTPDSAFAYVTNSSSNTISVIDTATDTVTATLPGGSVPWGIAIGRVNPPNCAGATASPNLIWPPNHKFVPIQISGVTNPAGGALTLTVTSIFQDEPVDSPGSGNTGPDATGVGTASPAVRAERDGGGDGRVYHISFTATSAGGSCTGQVTVGVPHDKSSTPVDGGPLYDSTQP
jgi:YVTN family beta-propeller protein